MRALFLVVALVISACGEGGGETDAAPADAGPPFDEGWETDRMAFAPFSGQLLALYRFVEVGADVSAAQGVQLQLDATASSLTVEFLNRDTGTVAGPITLTPDADHPGGFAASGLQLFGLDGVTLTARVRLESVEGDQVVLVLSPDGAMKPARTVVTPTRGTRERRAALWSHYLFTLYRDNHCNDLARFARFVQDVVDTAASLDSNRINRMLIIADDLSDLFIPPGHGKETMSAFGVTIGGAITEGRSTCESNGLKGFLPQFQAGEGRFRHFAANLWASNVAPGFLVNLAARAQGGDWWWTDDPTGDVAADLATNQVGRDFQTFISTLGNLDDGHSVRDWIIEHFGGSWPDLSYRCVTLIEAFGPYPAGAEIGLCRIPAGCVIAGPDACASDHLHGGEILIDETGPYAEPPAHQDDCGFGAVSTKTDM